MEFTDASLPKSSKAESQVLGLEEKPSATLTRHVNDALISRSIMRCVDAYIKDGIARQGVDVYTDHCSRFDIVGEKKIVDVLTKRLQEICFASGTTWDTLKFELIHELFKTGTAPLVKIRGTSSATDASKSYRGLYKDRPDSISRLAVISPLQFYPLKHKQKHIGWTLKGITFEEVQAYLGKEQGRGQKKEYKFKMDFGSWKPDSKTLINKLDVSVATYKKDPGTVFGIGLVMPVLDDLTNLKIAENLMVTMLKKHALPLTHYTIDRPKDPIQARSGLTIEQEISRARVNVVEAARHDSILITPAWHNIEQKGSESHALRVNEYLNYLTRRVITGMGIPAYLMGMDNTSTLAADKSLLGFIQNLASTQKNLESFFTQELFFELLWEMGYDPYTNPNHQVSIRFHQADGDILSKHESHVADLFTKGIIDIVEARQRIDIDSPINLSKTFQHLYGGAGPEEPKSLEKKEGGRPKKKDQKDSVESKLLDSSTSLQELYYIFEEAGIGIDPKEIQALLSEREVLLEHFKDNING